MGLNVKAIEGRIGDAVHSVLAELEGAEPAIERGTGAVLVAAGVPSPLAMAIEGLETEVLNHFRGQPTAAPAVTTSAAAGITPQLVEFAQPVAADQLGR